MGSKPVPKGNSSTLAGKPGVSKERRHADITLDPLAGAAAVATSFSERVLGKTDAQAAYVALTDRAKAIRSNELASVEDMLTGHAAALHALFLELIRRSGSNMGEHMQAAETYMRLGLKAQAQCRATLETLAAIKNPPVVYVRQANIASGPQQVNNGIAASRAIGLETSQNELLEAEHGTGERLDPGAAVAAIGGDPALEAVGAIDGAEDGYRQSSRQR